MKNTVKLSTGETVVVTRALIREKGYLKTIALNPDDIYVPIDDTDTPNNVCRLELDEPTISQLQVGMPNNPDWSVSLMVVRKIPGGKTVNGKTYWYELVVGFHRHTALTRQLVSEWIFDLYEFDDDDDLVDFQADENGKHLPRKTMGIKEWTNYLSYKVSKSNPKLTEKDLVKIMDRFINVHHSTKTSAIANAVAENGLYQDFKTYTWKEIQQTVQNQNNYPDGVFTYTIQGMKDDNRGEAGWTVKQGYEDEYLFNAMKKFHETGLHSYFTLHTKLPKKDETVQTTRDKMLSNFSGYEDALLSTIEYYKKHGKFPWRKESWFPQDNKQREKKFISCDD